MTIPISGMTANFASSNTVYTAIGMHVTDEGAANTSKLLHMTVDAESRFTIWKDGGLRISSNSDLVPANTKLFQINDKGRDIMSISSDKIVLASNTIFRNNIIVGAHVESFIDVYTTNSVAILDVSKASVFKISSSNNYISRIVIAGADTILSAFEYGFYNPDITNNTFPSISFTLATAGNLTIPSSVWDTARIYWSYGFYPISPTSNDVYVITSTYRETPTGTMVWHGIIAGQDFVIQS